MFESRTSELTEEQFRGILKDKCKDFISYPKLLQRSKTTKSSTYSYVNPKVFERVPAGGQATVSTRNHMLLMDNLPSWSKFPKRSNSVIGVTLEDPRSLFGEEKYLIIPYDGARFGVAPSYDLWGCGINIDKHFYSFDNSFANMFSKFGVSDYSYREMMQDLQNLYDNGIKPPTSFLGQQSDFDDHLYLKLKNIFEKARRDKFEKIEDAFNKYFDPKNFKGTDLDSMVGFASMRWIEKPYGGLASSFSDYDFYEFWTDSECLLYYIGKFNSGSDIEMAYHKFLDDFIK